MTSRASQELFNFLYLNDAPDVDTVLPWKWSVTRNKILYNIKKKQKTYKHHYWYSI